MNCESLLLLLFAFENRIDVEVDLQQISHIFVTEMAYTVLAVNKNEDIRVVSVSKVICSHQTSIQ